MFEALLDTKTAGQGSLQVCDPKSLPWAPWGLEGAYFKLLSVDPIAERFTLLIKLDPGCMAPIHRHVGAVEGMVLEGRFHYTDEPHIWFNAGMYLLEKEGAVHRPVSPEGTVLFAVFHGPIEVLDRNGEVVACLDWLWHRETWHTVLTNKE